MSKKDEARAALERAIETFVIGGGLSAQAVLEIQSAIGAYGEACAAEERKRMRKQAEAERQHRLPAAKEAAVQRTVEEIENE